MPFRKGQQHPTTLANTSKPLPLLNRGLGSKILASSPANKSVLVNGPASPTKSEHVTIEAATSPPIVESMTETRREPIFTANGSTNFHSVSASCTDADPNLSTLAIRSPTTSNEHCLVTKSGLNDAGSSRYISNHIAAVKSSHVSSSVPTETESNYISITGGRARHSNLIPAGLANFWPSNSIDRKEDSVMVPEAPKNVSDDPSGPIINRAGAVPVAAPNNATRSFFDSDSDSDSDDNRYQSPIISDVQVGSRVRPALVENKASDRQIGQILEKKVIGTRIAANNPGPSMSKVSQILGTPFKDLLDLTPAVDKDHPLASNPPLHLPELLGLGNSISKGTSTQDFAGIIQPISQLSFIPGSIVEAPPLDDEALDTIRSPGHPNTLTLHSQPPRWVESDGNGFVADGGSTPKRTFSAPPLRKAVRINTGDIVIRMGPGKKRLYRESVVSTPYPTRDPSVQQNGHVPSANETMQMTTATINPIVEEAANVRNFEKISIGKIEDTVLLKISIANQPLRTRSVAFPLSTPPSGPQYDDAALFADLRKQYYLTVGSIRRFFLARTLAAVSYHGPGSINTNFDTLDFFQHFNSRKTGARRRKWVLWARKLAAKTFDHPQNQLETPQPDSGYPSGHNEDELWDDIENAASKPTPPLPRLEFSHRFDVVKIGLMVFTILILSVAATLLWTFLGFPKSFNNLLASTPSTDFIGTDGVRGGLGSPMPVPIGHSAVPSVGYGFRDAAVRLETGLVLGVVVLLLGVTGIGSWVGASWILL